MSVGTERSRERPKPFADDWGSRGTPRPPTTVANALGGAGRVEPRALRPISIGARFRRYTPAEIAGVPSVDGRGGVDLSPDGNEVAFAWDTSGDLEIYSAPVLGDRVIQLTGAGKTSRAPRWSPDARWLAFLRSEGGGRTAIWLVDRDGEHERALTADGSSYGDHAWSPDGARLATTDDRGTVHVIDVASGGRRRIGDGSQPQWSPDGAWILFTRSDGDLAVVRATGGDARVLDTREGTSGRSSDGRWSPDGSAIAFTTTVRGHREVAFALLRDAAVTRVERLGATPFDDGEPAWRPDGRGVVYRRRADGDVSLRRAFTVSHADEAVSDVPGVHSSPRLGADSETVVAVFTDGKHPPDVVVRPKSAIALVHVTSSLPAGIDPLSLVDPIAVRTGDGPPSLVYVPHAEAGTGGLPVVLYVREPEREWDPVAQLLANAGHVVVASAMAGAADATSAIERVEGEGLGDGTRLVVIAPAGERERVMGALGGRAAQHVPLPPGLASAPRVDRARALDGILSGARRAGDGG